MNAFFTDEDAQATTEYVLILAVLVTLAILVTRDLIRPVFSRFSENLTRIINEELFNDGAGMHRSPFRPPSNSM